MQKFFCDMCRKELQKGALRYGVKIEVKAAYDTLEINLLDLLKDHRDEIRRLVEELKNADPQKIQDDVYKTFEFHLCYSCQQRYLRAPLPSGSEQDATRPGIHDPLIDFPE